MRADRDLERQEGRPGHGFVGTADVGGALQPQTRELRWAEGKVRRYPVAAPSPLGVEIVTAPAPRKIPRGAAMLVAPARRPTACEAPKQVGITAVVLQQVIRDLPASVEPFCLQGQRGVALARDRPVLHEE